MKEDIKNWLDKAKEDLKTAKILLENRRFDDCALYCQQSIEKALKSLYLKIREEIPKIHDISNLAKRLKLPEKLIDYCMR